MAAALVGCFGKTANEDGPWRDAQWSGVTSSGPTYSPLRVAHPSATQCNQGALVGGPVDSCLTTPIDCVGADDYHCYDYSSSDALTVSTDGTASAELVHDGLGEAHYGIGHYRAPTASDQVFGAAGSTDPQSFDFRMRVKVSAATGSLTLVRLRLPKADYSYEPAVLELTGSRLQLCVAGPRCVNVGTFGRDSWHTIVFTLEDGTLRATLDCQPPAQVPFDVFASPNWRDGVTIDYGIIWPTCASDVYIDMVRYR